MKNIEFGPIIKRGASLVLVTSLGLAACAGDKKESVVINNGLNPREVIKAVANSDGAIILEGLENCPEFRKQPPRLPSEISDVTHRNVPSVEIAQTYVGNELKNERGGSANLRAALVSAEYTVHDGDKNVSVYCGSEYRGYGNPYDGVMFVSETNEGLITDTVG